ncbi:hypothetical protein BDV95DRAFT_613142 [Massariosphaeria phaeospora]|uniref:BZIP domain-containing protein n=1 Tax=Massariosphaeria phaeospora TaxID=100035 RepID=A0A7C8HYH9_9PLEO|nr:hypothetical protein BDV95DRAFT_613142 [Massariosphaeria phaeospora]
MAATRRRKTKTPEEVPGAGDPERKRVLNILAQRRYRQRQKEKIAALEAQAQAKSQDSLQPVGQDEDVQVLDFFPELSTTTSSVCWPYGPIEEVVRSSDDFGFPEMVVGQGSLDMSLFEDLYGCHLPSANSLASGPQSSPSSALPPTLDFPLSSDAQLQVPILNVIRAFSSIAAALNIMGVVGDPNHLHVLPPTLATNLPWNLQPTPAQLTIPHHPMLDALPWPLVREKLICILSLPSMFRPPVAQDDEPCGTGQANAIQRLMHDLDDPQGGARVYGNAVGWDSCSELVEDAWEMGQCFYRNWWFCIDPNAMATSNRRRRERGVCALRLKG